MEGTEQQLGKKQSSTEIISDPENNSAIVSCVFGILVIISLLTVKMFPHLLLFLGTIAILSIPAIIFGVKGIKKAIKHNNCGLYVAGFGFTTGLYSLLTVLSFIALIIEIMNGLSKING